MKMKNAILTAMLIAGMLMAGIMLTACDDKDEGPSCKVEFDINGGIGTTPAPKTAKKGSSITLPDGSGFSKPDYTFIGWIPITPARGLLTLPVLPIPLTLILLCMRRG